MKDNAAKATRRDTQVYVWRKQTKVILGCSATATLILPGKTVLCADDHCVPKDSLSPASAPVSKDIAHACIRKATTR